MGFLSFIVAKFFDVLSTLVVIYIILSWFARDPYSFIYRIYRTLSVVAEPILTPFRNLMGRFSGASMGIDFSPILAILALSFLRSAVVRLLMIFGL